MAACNSGGSKQSDASGKKTDVEAATQVLANSEDKEVTEANYQSYLKKEYGVDAATPAGWKFNSVRANTYSEGNENVMLTFQAGDGAAKVADIAKALFDQTAAISASGNFAIDVDNNSSAPKKGAAYATFADLFKSDGLYNGVTSIDEFWYYNGTNGILCMVSVSADKGAMRVKFEKSPTKL
jgi:hypothetical protein